MLSHFYKSRLHWIVMDIFNFFYFIIWVFEHFHRNSLLEERSNQTAVPVWFVRGVRAKGKQALIHFHMPAIPNGIQVGDLSGSSTSYVKADQDWYFEVTNFKDLERTEVEN